MSNKTVFVFGAGATKACGGPLTNEILPDAFEIWSTFPGIEREGFLDLVNRYLIERNHVPPDIPARTKEDYPDLPRLLALLDAMIERNQNLGNEWSTDRLRTVRAGLDYLIFALIENKLKSLEANYYYRLLERCDSDATVISLNYDIIVDNAFCRLADYSAFPDYETDVSTDVYNRSPKIGKLLKLHGSLNWYYCPGCERLFLGVTESGKFYKVLEELYHEDPMEPRYSCEGSKCRECGTNVKAVLITPSHQRDYQNPHIKRIWDAAHVALQEADRAVIVGYSLPAEDVYVNSLLTTGLVHLAPSQITVVDMGDDRRPLNEHPVWRQYHALFGDGLDWHPEGFAGWLSDRTAAGERL